MFTTEMDQADAFFALLMAAVLLMSHWAIRGAPVGQALPKDPEGDPSCSSPVRPPRERLAALAALGIVVSLTAAYLGLTRGVAWAILPALAGPGLLAYSAFGATPYRHRSPTTRRIGSISQNLLSASLLGGILLLGNLIAFRYGGGSWDLTTQRVHSLSDQTKDLLAALKVPVRFTIIYGRAQGVGEKVELLDQLLRLYVTARADQVRLDRLDALGDPAGYRELVRARPEVAMMVATVGGGLLIELSDPRVDEPDAPINLNPARDRLALSFADLFFSRPEDAEANQARDQATFVFRGEDVVTSALTRLLEGDQPVIAFLVGRGQLTPQRLAALEPSASYLKSRLEAAGFRVEAINPAVADLDPSRVPLALLLSPREPLDGTELIKLRGYLKDGGRLILTTGASNDPVIHELLALHLLKLGSRVVVDNRPALPNQPFVVAAPIAPEEPHPIVQSLGNRAAIVSNAVELLIEDGPLPNVVVDPILRSRPGSWAEQDAEQRPLRFDQETDQPGPILLGAAVSVVPSPEGDLTPNRDPTRPAVPRMVVFSSPFLAEDSILTNAPTNEQLLLNAVNWLRGRPELLGISPRVQTAIALNPDDRAIQRMMLVPTVTSLALILIAGGAVWSTRRG
ncbi:ABC-type uncharacterized transport system [Isosphaera pallida ATCC 43644]|jgi:hypothetical protein|uniref:ABC-type uncharacterized transport system n=1 Tax=Isosphaera pallida (strain ATCC 43644 / DSM 9630 / IS1B) TaxID=575540 RepID=E8R2T0_ISOPI|nr:Gldg family protein [Isosphaera pallida]ADV63577.1 ABC-type uncharacterized transport system [Isosphaera pallida ATCC 43644]